MDTKAQSDDGSSTSRRSRRSGEPRTIRLRRDSAARAREILVVDSHSSVRKFVSRLLTGLGFHVREAHDGAEALVLAREAAPHLVMTEVEMPGLDGCALVSEMRGDARLQGVPVLFFTSGPHLARVCEMARDHAAVSLLFKPADGPEIVAAVSEALGMASEGDASGGWAAQPTQRLATETRLSALVEVGRRLAAERDAGRLLELLCRSASALLGARYVAAALLSEAGEPLRRAVCCAEHGDGAPCPTPRPAAVADLLTRSIRHLDHAGTALAPCLEHGGSCVVVPIRASADAPTLGWLVAAGREEGQAYDADDANVAMAMVGYAGTVLDRIRMDRQMVDDAVLLDGILDAAQDAVMVLDHGLRILRVNAHAVRLFEFPREELIGAPLTVLVPDAGPEPAGPPDSGGLVARCASGRSLPVTLTWTALAGSGPAAWVVNLHDRSDLVRVEDAVKGLEMQLFRSQKMEVVGRLAGGVAHDFNNMLTVIAGYSELLLGEEIDKSMQRAALEEIRSAADEAGSLTRQLLAFSRREAQAPAPVDLSSVVYDVEKMVRRLVGETIETELRLAPDLGLARMDPGQVGQILIHLVVAARAAMENAGRLCVETANVYVDAAMAREMPPLEAGSYVMLAVADTGPGLDDETVARLNDPLFAATASGTGVGLSVVCALVRQSGGHVQVNATPGLGTMFRIYLPCIGAAPPEALAAAPGEGAGPDHATVLLVEDEEGVRRLAQRVLERDGMEVLCASNGREALDIFQRHSSTIDLVLTDTVMPQMSGPELGLQLRLLRPQVKLLFASGYSDHHIFHRTPLEGEMNFIAKPFRPNALCRKVRELLGRPVGAVAS